MLRNNTLKNVLTASALILLISMPFTETYAQQGGRGGPPEEAIEACADKAANDTCSFSSPRGDMVEGSCLSPPGGRDGPLACAPEGGGHRPLPGSR